MTLTPFPVSLRLRSDARSVRTSRTLRLAEPKLVLGGVDAKAQAEDYAPAIIEENVPGKLPARTTWQRFAKRLTELYALDPGCTRFRLLRHFWPAGSSSRPMLGFLLAAARHALLRETMPFVVGIKLNEPVTTEIVSEHLSHQYPKRFALTTLRSTFLTHERRSAA